MAKFVYNNAKNVSISHVPFELNCGVMLWHVTQSRDYISRSILFSDKIAIL